MKKVAAGEPAEALDALAVPPPEMPMGKPPLPPEGGLPAPEALPPIPTDLPPPPPAVDPIDELKEKLEAAIGKTTKDEDLESETDEFIQE